MQEGKRLPQLSCWLPHQKTKRRTSMSSNLKWNKLLRHRKIELLSRWKAIALIFLRFNLQAGWNILIMELSYFWNNCKKSKIWSNLRVSEQKSVIFLIYILHPHLKENFSKLLCKTRDGRQDRNIDLNL